MRQCRQVQGLQAPLAADERTTGPEARPHPGVIEEVNESNPVAPPQGKADCEGS